MKDSPNKIFPISISIRNNRVIKVYCKKGNKTRLTAHKIYDAILVVYRYETYTIEKHSLINDAGERVEYDIRNFLTLEKYRNWRINHILNN